MLLRMIDFVFLNEDQCRCKQRQSQGCCRCETCRVDGISSGIIARSDNGFFGWSHDWSLCGGGRVVSRGILIEAEAWIVNDGVEIAAFLGDTLGNSGLVKFDSGNLVKDLSKVCLACQTLAWFACGCWSIQL